MIPVKFSFRLFKKLPQREKKITLSTAITLARIALTPIIVIAMVYGSWGIAFWLFIGAAISDVLDGYLARLLNDNTFLGACLDPLADKLLILSVFFTLAFISTPLFVLPAWFVITVLAKEMLLIVSAIFLFIKQGHLEVRPLLLGKLAMIVQTLFIIWLFSCYFFHWMPVKTYTFMLGVVLIVVLASLVGYAWMILKSHFYLRI